MPSRPEPGPDAPPAFPRARLAAELVVALLGMGLIVAAMVADQHWFDRHFLPDLFAPRAKQMRLLWGARALAAALGLGLAAFARPAAGRLAGRIAAGRLAALVAPILLAMVLAVVATEAVLESTPWRALQEAPAAREPLRRRDPVFGWVFLTDRAGVGEPVGGRRVQYAIDGRGYRVARPGDQVDLTRPSILFTGESIIFGHGLTWDESIPAQVERRTGVQAADLAVEAYAPDQAYLRLAAELPRFHRPVAVVTIFMPSLFGRILDDDRPHLGPAMTVQPPARRWRLATLAKRWIPYRSRREIDYGVAHARAVYRATLQLARARGATPLIVVPQYRPETAAERLYRRRVLDDAGLPYLLVPLEPGWKILHNKHPDAEGAGAVAGAVADSLRGTGALAPRPAGADDAATP